MDRGSQSELHRLKLLQSILGKDLLHTMYLLHIPRIVQFNLPYLDRRAQLMIVKY